MLFQLFVTTRFTLTFKIFTGRMELCLKVQEKDMKRIFELMVTSKNQETQAQFMVALQAIAKVALTVHRACSAHNHLHACV